MMYVMTFATFRTQQIYTHTNSLTHTQTVRAYDNGQSPDSICLAKSNFVRQMYYIQYTLLMGMLLSSLIMNVWTIFSPYHKHCSHTDTYTSTHAHTHNTDAHTHIYPQTRPIQIYAWKHV